MKKVQLTKEGFDNLKKEYQEFKDVKKPLAIDALQKARAMGDLKENGAYHAAREELGLIESRVLEIEEILKTVEVIENSNNNNIISIGSKVTVNIDERSEKYQIVGEFEADPMNRKLSSTSPIGKSLLGKKIGESVTVEVPAGKLIFKIISIK